MTFISPKKNLCLSVPLWELSGQCKPLFTSRVWQHLLQTPCLCPVPYNADLWIYGVPSSELPGTSALSAMPKHILQQNGLFW